jgi:steroid delta-isomerase-like uncharacterized protein
VKSQEDPAGAALETVSAYLAALVSGHHEKAAALRAEGYALDYVHADAFREPPAPAEQVEEFWAVWFSAFSEFDFQAKRTLAAEDVVAVEWIFLGTHTAPLGPPAFTPPAEPTGRTIRIRGASFYDVRGGKIQRETLYLDMATLMVELGYRP